MHIIFYIPSYKGKRSRITLHFETVIKDPVSYSLSKLLFFRSNAVYQPVSKGTVKILGVHGETVPC